MISRPSFTPEDLKSAEVIGRSAGERAVRRLKPRKVESQAVPVIFDRRVAASLAGHLVAAAMGSLDRAQDELPARQARTNRSSRRRFRSSTIRFRRAALPRGPSMPKD